jgi:HD-GYP domain-containing protein (c-di-GMP phosphodiesterase class II)
VKPVDAHANLASLRDSLAGDLRPLGVVLLACDVEGGLLPHAPASDWLTALFASPPLQQVVRRLAPDWQVASAGAPIELVPGLWMAVVPVGSRRTRTGSLLCTVVDDAFQHGEHVDAMCQAARLDRTLIRTLLNEPAPPPAHAAARLAAMAALTVKESLRDRHHSHELENVGQKLSDLYEEMNLLYTIIQSMTVGQQPRKFLSLVCRELFETMPYAWVGVQLVNDHRRIPQVAGELIVAEGSHVDVDALRPLTAELASTATPDEPLVLLPTTVEEQARFAAMGRSVVVHPIGREEKLLGVIMAGDKRGEDETVSSVDLKLLAATASHLAIFLENAGLYEDIHTMFLGTLEALTAAIDAKDRYTCGHSQRVALLSQQLAAALKCDEELVQRVRIAGLVHDVGKIGVPEQVLCKTGRLTEEEFAWIRRHPEIGHRILRDIPQLNDVLPGVLYHHERWDGAGYPAGLKGDQIPLVARIISLADSFDAMSSNRTYRSARDRAWVLAEIVRCAGSQFDPEFARVFATLNFAEYDRQVAEHRAIDHTSLDAKEAAA